MEKERETAQGLETVPRAPFLGFLFGNPQGSLAASHKLPKKGGLRPSQGVPILFAKA